MLTITTAIRYPAIATKSKQTQADKRAERAAQGLCQGCGGSRPCFQCGARSTASKRRRRVR